MRTTFGRTFLPAAMVLLAALLIVGIALKLLVSSYMKEQAVSSLEKDGQAICELASAYYSSETSASRHDFMLNLTLVSRVSGGDAVIFDREGILLLCSDAPFGCKHQGLQVNRSYIDRVLEKGKVVDTGRFKGLYEESRFVVTQPLFHAVNGKLLGFVMVSAPTRDYMQVERRISNIYIMLSVLVVAAAMIIMSIYARQQSKPLRAMAKAAHAFGHGDLNARVRLDKGYTRETEELALAFNNMASSLQKTEYQRQEFVANVSHELKTPMTTISGYLDGILDGTIPEERREHYMRIVSDETKRLSRLVRSMLDISRLQEQAIPDEKKTRFDLLECVGRVLLTFEGKITGKDLQVDVDFPDCPVYTRAAEDSITQVVYNLLDNAVKFCPQGGELSIRITKTNQKAYVGIANSGQTIPAEELPLVFDRFHKLDKSRSENRDGWGLGLYIVKTIISSHGENISVTSRDGRTEFSFTLPIVI
ncbi:MAG: HAMP domain-containing histidine kinase [Oscillospiraceae bacterium]|nr:HAMP domain-containing histidine kinase [Oscillospiraceae bacterium]